MPGRSLSTIVAPSRSNAHGFGDAALELAGIGARHAGRALDRPHLPGQDRVVDVALHAVAADRLEDVRVEAVDVGVPGDRQGLGRLAPARPGLPSDPPERDRACARELHETSGDSMIHSSPTLHFGSPEPPFPHAFHYCQSCAMKWAYLSPEAPDDAIPISVVPLYSAVPKQKWNQRRGLHEYARERLRCAEAFHVGAQRRFRHRSLAACWAFPRARRRGCSRRWPASGLLTTLEGKPGYRVGNLIFETSRRHRSNSTLSLFADEALGQIAKATGHTGYVAILDRTEMLGLRMRHGTQALRVVTSPGDRLPAFCLGQRPRPAGPPRRRGRARTPCRAAAAAVAPCAADDRRPAGRARAGPRQGLGAGDRRMPAGRRVARRLRARWRERRDASPSASPIPPP